MKDVVFRNGMNPLTAFALALLQSCPYQVSGSFAGGSDNHLNTLSAWNATLLRQPGGLRESRKMAEAFVLPAFLLTQLLHLSPCLFSSSFWIARASRCLAIVSSGKVNAAPLRHGKSNNFVQVCAFSYFLLTSGQFGPKSDHF